MLTKSVVSPIYPGAGEHGLAHPESGAFIDSGSTITAAVSTRDRVRIPRWYFAQLALSTIGLCGWLACVAGQVGDVGGTGGAGGSNGGGPGGGGAAGTTTGGASGSAGTPDAGAGEMETGGSRATGAGGTDGGARGDADGATAGSTGSAGAGGGPATDGGAGFSPCPTNGTPCAIMPLGDSITFGFGSTTGGGYRVDLFSKAVAAGKSITFVGSQSSGPATVSGKAFPPRNEGHSGYTIDDSASTKGISPLVDQAIATYKPNIVLLMIGTNDMHYALDTANAPTRLGRLIDRITTDAPGALVVVATIIPANGAQNALGQTYNAAIPAIVQQRAQQGKHVVMVDMFSAIKIWSFAMFTDSEHPNDAGYSTMATIWYPAIESALR